MLNRVRSVETLGRCELLFPIAAGGMAEVYAARSRGEEGFERLVAVKRMHAHLAEDEEFVRMFLDEAQVAAYIHSPHVVSTLDLGRAADGSLYIVMDLVIGASLKDVVKTLRRAHDPLPIPFALEVIAQAAQGLYDAHTACTPAGDPLLIVHRDVSPHNILVGADGLVRITDFGIARALQRHTQTASGQLKGKFSYMAPEQVNGAAVDHTADVFALGVVAWELIAGRSLFGGSEVLSVLHRVCTMPIPPLPSLREEVPVAAWRTIQQALERDPKKRISSTRELVSQLRETMRTLDLGVDPGELAAFVAEHDGGVTSALRARIRAVYDSATAHDIPLGSDSPGATTEDVSAVRAGTARSRLHERETAIVARHDGTEAILDTANHGSPTALPRWGLPLAALVVVAGLGGMIAWATITASGPPDTPTELVFPTETDSPAGPMAAPTEPTEPEPPSVEIPSIALETGPQPAAPEPAAREPQFERPELPTAEPAHSRPARVPRLGPTRATRAPGAAETGHRQSLVPGLELYNEQARRSLGR